MEQNEANLQTDDRNYHDTKGYEPLMAFSPLFHLGLNQRHLFLMLNFLFLCARRRLAAGQLKGAGQTKELVIKLFTQAFLAKGCSTIRAGKDGLRIRVDFAVR